MNLLKTIFEFQIKNKNEKKTLKDLYKSQYGQTPYFIKYDSILDDVIREDYWKLFEINKFELNTIDL